MEKYEIVNWPSKTDRIDIGSHGALNRKTLSDAKADKLFKDRVSFIREKKAKAKTKP